MATNLPAPPLLTPLFNGLQDPTITRVWFNWFLALMTRVQTSAWGVQTISLTGQEAAIALTSLVAAPGAGVYRMSWYLRITTAASTSSSVQLTITHTDGAVVCTQSGAAVTGNATDSVQSGSVLVRTDAAAPISYSVAYASVGATKAQFAIDLCAESL